jgi:predicted ATPase/class 3 adenylate cyclase
MSDLPTGTVTFLFTDIEGSTELWERFPDETRQALVLHDRIIEEAVSAQNGQLVRPRGEGDSRFAVFTSALEAVCSAANIQRRLMDDFSDSSIQLRVRIGIHTGTADLRLGDYYGSTVNRCARIRSVGHGGQTLLSQVTSELVREELPQGISLLDLGNHRLKGLGRPENIYQLSLSDLPAQFPPLNSLSSDNNNLPIPPTPFIGRMREVNEIVQLLKETKVRLLTLTGPGGTGKTRLSLEASRALLEEFAHGVFFVDLASIEDPALTASTIAHTLGVREGGGAPPLENLKAYLSDKKMLLILDNFEQIPAAAPQVAELLSAAPNIKILVTSRIALSIRGEQQYPVPTLKLPDSDTDLDPQHLLDYEAVRLFVQQAQAVRPAFELNQENASTIVKICRRLDGLPLAIEIAAARIKILSPEAILKRLDNSLQLLVGGAQDLPERQQTVRSVIDWSYRLLEPEEQTLFARLSVFKGGFTLENAESICNSDDSLDVFSGVDALLKNNLIRQADSVTDEPRFNILQTIRDYAWEKLGESGEREHIRQRHATYFAQKSEEIGPKLYSGRSGEAINQIEEDHDNYRAAISWELEQTNQIERSTQISIWLVWFWYRHGHFQEGRDWTERILAKMDRLETTPLQGAVLTAAAVMSMWQGDLAIAAVRGYKAVASLENNYLEFLPPQVYMSLGIILINQGKDQEAYPMLVQAAEYFDQIGDEWSECTSIVHLANAALGLGQYDDAKKWLNKAMPKIKEIGDEWQMAFAYNNFGEVARTEQRYQEAEEYYRKTQTYYREADALSDQARSIHTFGYLWLHKGEYKMADACFRESLEKFIELGNKRGIAECLAGLAGLANAQGQHEWALPLLSAAQTQLSAFGAAWWPADRVEIEHTLDSLRSNLEDQRFSDLWKLGETMSLNQAVTYAQNQGALPL